MITFSKDGFTISISDMEDAQATVTVHNAKKNQITFRCPWAELEAMLDVLASYVKQVDP